MHILGFCCMHHICDQESPVFVNILYIYNTLYTFRTGMDLEDTHYIVMD